MPYIPKDRRDALASHERPRTAGELNWVITRAVLEFLPEKPRYEDFNRVIGVLESAKIELYRRMIAEYEDASREANGEVYPPVT